MLNSSSWNHLSRKIAVGVFFAGAVGWLLFCSLQNGVENNLRNERKKNSAKEKQRSTSKGRQGVSATNHEAAPEKKVTKDGDAVSDQETRIKSPKKNKTSTKTPEFIDPVAAPPNDTTALPVSTSSLRNTSSSTSSTVAGSVNQPLDKVVLPPPPPKKEIIQDVPSIASLPVAADPVKPALDKLVLPPPPSSPKSVQDNPPPKESIQDVPPTSASSVADSTNPTSLDKGVQPPPPIQYVPPMINSSSSLPATTDPVNLPLDKLVLPPPPKENIQDVSPMPAADSVNPVSDKLVLPLPPSPPKSVPKEESIQAVPSMSTAPLPASADPPPPSPPKIVQDSPPPTPDITAILSNPLQNETKSETLAAESKLNVEKTQDDDDEFVVTKKLLCDCGIEMMDEKEKYSEATTAPDASHSSLFKNKTQILPMIYEKYRPLDLIHPPEKATELSSFVTKKPDMKEKTTLLTPFRPILHSMYYAHRHALLINDLIENYDLLED